MTSSSDGTRPSDMLLSHIDELFRSAGISPRDITTVLYAHGPGSFTALRIGLATVQGLFLPADNPVMFVGVSSLKLRCLGLATRFGKSLAIVAVTAGRDRIFFGRLALVGDKTEFDEGVMDSREFRDYVVSALTDGGIAGGTAFADWRPDHPGIEIHAGETLVPKDFLTVSAISDNAELVPLARGRLNYVPGAV